MTRPIDLPYMTIGQLVAIYEEEFGAVGKGDPFEKPIKLLRRVDFPYSPNHAKEVADLLLQMIGQMTHNGTEMSAALTAEFKNRIDEYRNYSSGSTKLPSLPLGDNCVTECDQDDK